MRLLHRVAFGQDGLAGASRTLVFNRAPGEEPAEDLRAAEVRFARVFNSTPMAMAIVDRGGRIKRSNAAFAKLMPEALKGTERRSAAIYAGVLEATAPRSKRRLAPRRMSKTDIAPVDVQLSRRSVGALALHLGGGRSGRPRRDDLRARYDGTAHAEGEFRAIAEDAGHRPARRRRRA